MTNGFGEKPIPPPCTANSPRSTPFDSMDPQGLQIENVLGFPWKSWQNQTNSPTSEVLMSRKRLYLDHAEAIEEALRFINRRHHCSPDEAEDFASWTRLKLVEDDYAILASFEGRSKMRTFLRIVLQRLFLDYRRMIWGRWRPSEEAKRLGPLAVRLETLLSRDGLALDDAYQRLQAVDPNLSRRQVEEIAARLPIRKARPVEDKNLLMAQSQEPTPEAEMIENETETARRRATSALPLLLRQLPPRDQMILRLRFAEGLQIVDIAARLHLEVRPLYRHIERLKAELRRELEVRGFEAEGLGWPAAVPTPHRRVGASRRSPFLGEAHTHGRLNKLEEKP